MSEKQGKTHGPELNPALWVERYGDDLFRYALFRLRDPVFAEDLVQETFLAALSAQGQFRGNSSEKTWLIGILKHKVFDHFRKTSHEQPSRDSDITEDVTEEAFDEAGKWKAKVA